MSSDTSTPFSVLIGELKRTAESFEIDLPVDWLQGRTAYGGPSASLCLEAVLRSFPDPPPLRSAQFCFIGPATGTLKITPSILRQGKSTTFCGAQVEGESGVAARATFCFGTDRILAFDHSLVTMPSVAPVEQCPSYYTWPVRPNFMDHFEGRLAGGARPRTPGATPDMRVWLRHRHASVNGGIVPLLAMADALPPASTVLFPEPAPISTMMWSIDMLESAPKSETGWWFVECTASTAQRGYSVQDTAMWNAEGKPILLARQNVALFPKS